MTGRGGISRRGLLGSAGAGAALAGGLAGAFALGRPAAAEPAAPTFGYDFHGAHQAGIVTPAQDRMHFAAFDLDRRTTREGLIALLRDWTDAAVRLTRGEGAGPVGSAERLLRPAAG